MYAFSSLRKDNLRVGFRIAPVDFLAGCCLRLDYTFGGLLLRGFLHE